MLRRLSITGLTPFFRDGVCVNVSFSQVSDVARLKHKDERRRFWEDGAGSRLLQPDSLVVLIFNAPLANDVMTTPVIVLCTVLPKGRDRLGDNEAECNSLQLRTFRAPGDENFDDLSKLLSFIKTNDLTNW